MPTKVIPKNQANSCQRITFFRIIDSGMETVTMAVIKAKAVPRGTPLPTKASITGITLTELAYSGAPSRVAKGTAHQERLDRYRSTNEAGTNPWIIAPIPTPKSTYGNTVLVIVMPSSQKYLSCSFKVNELPAFSASTCCLDLNFNSSGLTYFSTPIFWINMPPITDIAMPTRL